MALAWSLPTLFDTPITYFYVLYFLILLIHRQRRDDEACQKKSVPYTLLSHFGPDSACRYGDDWIKYKKLVPYRIFPYVY